MNFKLFFLFAATLFFASIFCTKQASAQYQVESNSYFVRIVNEWGFPIRIRVVGFRNDANYTAVLRNQGSEVQELYSGIRVFCIWKVDGPNRFTFLTAAPVSINRGGVLRLTRVPTAGGGGGGNPKGGTPKGELGPYQIQGN